MPHIEARNSLTSGFLFCGLFGSPCHASVSADPIASDFLSSLTESSVLCGKWNYSKNFVPFQSRKDTIQSQHTVMAKRQELSTEFEDNFSETLWEIRLKVVRTRLPIGRLRVVAFPSTTSWVRLHAISLHASDNAPCIPSPMDGLCPVLMPLARR